MIRQDKSRFMLVTRNMTPEERWNWFIHQGGVYAIIASKRIKHCRVGETRPCIECGKDLIVTEIMARQRKYIHRECATLRRRRQKVEAQEKICGA